MPSYNKQLRLIKNKELIPVTDLASVGLFDGTDVFTEVDMIEKAHMSQLVTRQMQATQKLEACKEAQELRGAIEACKSFMDFLTVKYKLGVKDTVDVVTGKITRVVDLENDVDG